MNKYVLTEERAKKEKYNSFEIEKSISDHVFIVTIFAQSEFISVNIKQNERLIHIISRPFVGDFNQKDTDEIEDYCFLLPDCVEVEGFYMREINQRTYLIFRKMNGYKDYSYYY